MAERRIVTEILHWLRAQRCYAVKIHGGPMQEAGIPDILFCWHGRFCGCEVKIPGKDATDLQKYHLCNIAEAGGIAFAAHSLDEFKKKLEANGP